MLLGLVFAVDHPLHQHTYMSIGWGLIKNFLA